MYKKHSIEERLEAVKKCLFGHSPKTIGQAMGISSHEISEWLLLYKSKGYAGLQKRPMKHATFAEKCEIVCEYAENGIPLYRVCAEHSVSQSAVKRWTRIYRKGGYEALRTIKPQGTGRKNMGRPKKQEPQTELERLRYENEYLRAEVALLKKVRALMEEKEKRLQEIGRKPSKH